MNFNIPQILSLAGNIRYNPAVALAVNNLLTATSEVEYTIALAEATQQVLGYQIERGDTRKDYGRGGQLGMPLFQPLVIKGVNGLDDLLLESAVLSLSRTKNVVTTAIQGREGTVKEWINNGDFSITFNGLLVAKGWDFPIEATALFNEFMEVNQSLKLEHEVLNNLGIFEAVVMDYALPSTTYTNVQPYTIQLLSDNPFELVVSDLPDIPQF
jgi:hypothetical protein